MNNNIFIDSQGVILLDGQEANISLEYNEAEDRFYVEADCENWADNLIDFCREYYPEDDPMPTVESGRDDCKEISGTYWTLREINQVLERYCERGSWYEFRWEYEDGTPVE